jgi:hypothetical protein
MGDTLFISSNGHYVAIHRIAQIVDRREAGGGVKVWLIDATTPLHWTGAEAEMVMPEPTLTLLILAAFALAFVF